MGCECNKDIFKSAYDDEVITVRAQTPEISEHELRVKVAQNLRPRFRADMDWAKQEASGEVNYEGPHFNVSADGDVIYPGYNNMSLDELHERQLRILPDEYSPEEHATSRLIREAFRNGATRVVTSYARDGVDNRDIVVLEIDPVTREGRMRIINTSKNGTNNDFNTITSIIEQQFSNLKKSSASDTVVVFSDKTVSAGQMDSSVKPILEYKIRTPILTDTEDTVLYAGSRIALDTRETVMSFRRFIESRGDAKKNDVRKLPFYERLFGTADYRRLFPVSSITHRHVRGPIVSKEHSTFKKHTQIKEKVEHSRKLSTQIARKIKAESRNKRRAEKVVLRRKKNRKESAQILLQREMTPKIERSARQKPRTLLYKETITLKKKEKRIIPKEISRIVRTWEKVCALAKVFRTLEKKQNRKEQKQVEKRLAVKRVDRKETLIRLIAPKETKKQKEKKAVVGFVFGILLWHILQKPIQGSRVTRVKKEIKKSEKSPWLLPAIIWYLAQIREQGMVQIHTQAKPKKHKKIKKKTLYDPQSNGIIFAYSS